MARIEQVDSAAKAHQLAKVLTEVWGDGNAISVDVIVAVIHSGGYASIAAQDGGNNSESIVGGSLALVGKHDDKLHSHVTGVVAGHVNAGIGRALKEHQWHWAKAHGFATISWTFDPLVRRNAHFNLLTLGATVVSYHRDFYGELNDLINAGDSTDRLVVERQVAGLGAPPHCQPIQSQDDDEVIETPVDIVAMRQSSDANDKVLMRQWRERQRESFESAFSRGKFVRGFTDDGRYVLGSKVG